MSAKPIRTLLVLMSLLGILGFIVSTHTPIAHAAGIIVNDLNDNSTGGNGKCTLREAINNANGNTDTTSGDCLAGVAGLDTITFSVSGTITLGSALPAISEDLTIDGTGQSVTVSGNDASHILFVPLGKKLTVNALAIAHGKGGTGGGIANQGTLTVTNSTFANNSATASGGGIYNDTGSTLIVANNTFANNSTSGSGGGIYNYGTLTVTNSTFTNNSATNSGGGIDNELNSTLHMTNSTVYGNSANAGGGQGGALIAL